MLTAKEQKLLAVLEPRAVEEGIELVTIEVVGAKKSPTIRVYIDAENGVSFDELASAQVWISTIMDEIDPFPGAYTLEVSSPGIDRPLRTIEHFVRFKGETAVLKAKPSGGRSSWTGIILDASDDFVTLEVDGNPVQIPYNDIKRAHLKGTIDFNS